MCDKRIEDIKKLERVNQSYQTKGFKVVAGTDETMEGLL